ncbi:MAG: low molecular weight protein-tyrosine-phosphatase [Bacteroidota bacterium]|jgi:protein-tyrosine phosphatase
MKILFVCLGNICRSPVAEGILRQVCEQNQLNWHIDSAGLIDWHKGENPDPRSIQNALKNGTNISTIVSRPLLEHDLDLFDEILLMDKQNMKGIKRFRSFSPNAHKIKLAGTYIHPTNPPEIPDPYDGIEKDFQEVYDLLFSIANTIVTSTISRK